MQPSRNTLFVVLVAFDLLLSLARPAHAINESSTHFHLEDANGKHVANGVVALTCENLKPNTSINEASATSEPAIMDQVDRQFVPHVLAVSVNTPVRFPNSDDIHHHVYSFSKAKPFELELYHGATAAPVIMNNEGMVVLGCNIHDQMLGYIFVIKGQHFGVTDAQGNIEINTSDIAPNTDCKTRVLHPQLGTPYEAPSTIIKSDSSQQIIKLPMALSTTQENQPATGLKGVFKPKRFGQ